MDVGRIVCYGSCVVPREWKLSCYSGINRLYYIHGGKGTYTVGGRKHDFRPGKLYFLPYTAKYTLQSDPSDRLVHTFADFELIPPVFCDGIFEFSPKTLADRAALDVFLAGAVDGNEKGENHTHLPLLRQKPELFSFCMKSIAYLVLQIISENGVSCVKDEIVISVLGEMLDNLDKPFSIADAAAARFVSADGLIRRFKRILGITPYAYLKSLRLGTARYLINEGRTLEETAAAVGYADASSLSHAIGKTGVGKSPS